jgi:proline iminopeptidase
MTVLYPEIEPYEHGLLDVGDGDLVYWETCGNPDGKPAVFLHGGPGSGCSERQRRAFDPGAYRIVLFDQRNCGRSTPHASEPDIDLAANTTQHLVADLELLRERLDVDRWLVFGGSWGSTLALAYAEAHPDRVTELILAGVTTGRHGELDWLFRGGISMLFPEQWDRLRDALPTGERDGDVPAAYSRLLHDSDPEVCRLAAFEWCMWESATPDWPPTTGLHERYQDPAYALAFARLVTHYVSHDLFLEDEVLMRGAGTLADIPGILINGRFDLQAPLGNAWELKRVWPRAELVVVDDAGHSAHPGLTQALIRATDRFG